MKTGNQYQLITIKQDYNQGRWKPSLYDSGNPPQGSTTKRITPDQFKLAKVKRNRKFVANNLPYVPHITWISQRALGLSNIINHGYNTLKLEKPRKTDFKPTNIKLQILYQNIRSLGNIKAKQLRAAISPFTPDIISFAEVRNPIHLKAWSKTHTIIQNTPKTHKGGVSIIISKSSNIIKMNKDLEDLIILSAEKHGTTYIVAVAYLKEGINKASRLAQIINLIHIEAFNYVSPSIFLCGDFNMPKEQTFLRAFNKEEFYIGFNKLKIIEDYELPTEFEPRYTRKGKNRNNETIYSRLDYLITNTNPTVKLTYHPNISDHCMFAIQAPLQNARIRKIQLYNRKKLTEDLLNIPNITLKNLIDHVTLYKHKYSVQRRVEKVQMDLSNFNLPEDLNGRVLVWSHNFQKFAKDIAELRFSPMQGYAFKIIRQITKYDCFLKRDGSIITVLKLQCGRIITYEHEVNRLLLKVLTDREQYLLRVHGNFSLDPPPALPPLTNQQISSLISRLATKKALTDFPIPDEFIHSAQSEAFLTSLNLLWNPTFLLNNNEIFDSRLIPLNKVHPNVPEPHQMRPIVVTNVLFKLLEMRLNDVLYEKFNLLPKISESQVGFIHGMSTQVNIKKLLDYVTKPYYSDKNKPGAPYIRLSQAIPGYPLIHPSMRTYIVFIDYEQAFNSINMRKLFNRMKNLKHQGQPMFDIRELKFLFWAYQQLKIHIGKEQFKTKYGVPQGGINSPILFDWAIYF